MTEKEWLSRYNLLEKDIAAQEESLARLAAAATSVTAKNGGGGRSTGVSRKIENAVAQADKIKAEIRNMRKEQHAIVKAIDRLKDPSDRAVLRYLYVLGLTQEQTAAKMHYCDRKSIWKKRNRALSRIRVPEAYK